ncbi:MAG: hypothetical protein RL662_1421 [Bacteroidota bacterium]|jgi:exonuclease SbcC
MKIQAIRGKNLASLEGEFDIDFTTEPLRSAGIFAITGQTGAGKSTLLDALCLALFDDTPRLHKAESIKKEDLEFTNDKISPQDSKNILRLGAAEGYAEVDFVALNGDRYRARWMVRRARGKSHGALQPTTIRLHNLTANAEEGGTKTDLLNRIKEVIGLSFDQFTRAVLLAQGDFATFLKAKQNEKAELLEKLTGTDIYSKISTLIYKKTGDAKLALDLLLQRIQDIQLLTDEELNALTDQRNDCVQQLIPLKEQATSIGKQQDWIRQHQQLEADKVLAQTQLNTLHEHLAEAAPRYLYMQQLEASQVIRDSYIELANNHKQQNTLAQSSELKLKQQQDTAQQLASTTNQLATAKNQLDELEEKYEACKPDLSKAAELDINLRTGKELLTKTDEELNTLQKQLTQVKQDLDLLQNTATQAQQTKTELDAWFTQHQAYANMVARTHLLVAIANTAQTVLKQKKNAQQSLASSQNLLQTHAQHLALLEQEAQRLQTILPTEVLNLRNKLVHGTPCPVCGSCEHPLHETKQGEQGINEQELEQAKTINAHALSAAKDQLDSTQKGIDQLQIHLANFGEQHTLSINELTEYLNPLPHWHKLLDQGALAQQLTAIDKQWNDNKNLLNDATQLLNNNLIRIEAENKTLASLHTRIDDKQQLHNSQKREVNDLTEQRTQLFGGKSIQEIENRYKELKSTYAKKHEQLRADKESLTNKMATEDALLAQQKDDMDNLATQARHLQQMVQQWMDSNLLPTSHKILDDLMAKQHEWIVAEKEYLDTLRNKELVQKTTLDERKSKLDKHLQAPDKPEEGLDKDSLQNLCTEINTQTDTVSKRLTALDVQLGNHAAGKQRIQNLEGELNEKKTLFDNWNKLNDLLGSAKGDKFKTIAQGYTLDVLLGYANKHLEDLTGQYKLEKITDTLALQVIDNDMLGQVRTVHSLSGGESFLISLSLALGLSSLSSNRMKVESLFIDEGFGSLDIETLSVAMDALENLQMQGRKIGVISHVEEMKERITTQIQVLKSGNGKSIIKVVG